MGGWLGRLFRRWRPYATSEHTDISGSTFLDEAIDEDYYDVAFQPADHQFHCVDIDSEPIRAVPRSSRLIPSEIVPVLNLDVPSDSQAYPTPPGMYRYSL